MIRTKRNAQCVSRADGRHWKWLVLALLAAIAVLLSLDLSLPAQARGPEIPYVTNAADIESDCGDTERLPGEHCHATVTSSAYAHFESIPATSDNVTGGHPLPTGEDVRISRSVRPNLQPPKHSIRA